MRKQEQQYTLELVGQHRRYHLARLKLLDEFSLKTLQTQQAQLQTELALFIREKMLKKVEGLQKVAAEVSTSIMQTTDYAEQIVDELSGGSNPNKAKRRKDHLGDLEANSLAVVKTLADTREQVSVLERYLLPDGVQ